MDIQARPFLVYDRRTERGVTLLEVLVAVTLVSLTFMTVFSTYSTSLLMQQDTDLRSKAMFIAQQVIEETATIPYEELTPGTQVDVYDDEFPGALLVSTTVQDMPDSEISALWTRLPDPDPSAEYKLVTVSVDWQGRSSDPGGIGDWENVTLDWIRVQRENTVNFDEKPFSQTP